MVVAVYILSLLVFLMLTGVLPVGGGGQSVVFRSPVMLALMGALGVDLVVCTVRRRLSWRRAGFYLTHFAVVIILLGAFLGFLVGQETTFRAPISGQHVVRQLPVHEGHPIELPFGLAVTDFEVTFYDPDYVLYRPLSPDANPAEEDDYQRVREVRVARKERLRLGEHGVLDVADLKDEQGGWVDRKVLEDGWLLRKTRATPRRFAAEVLIEEEDGTRRTEELAVNHPIQQRGWRFYLQDYGERFGGFVVLSARRDPGRPLVIPGMYGLILGVAIMCFRGRGGRTNAA